MSNESKGASIALVGVIVAVVGLTAAAVFRFSSVTKDVDDIKEILDAGIPTDMPIGSIVPYWFESAPSDGWLVCNGDLFDGEKYPRLAELLGGTSVPDLRGMFLRGAGQNENSKFQYEGDNERRPGSPQSESIKIPDSAHTDEEGDHYHTTVFWYNGYIGYDWEDLGTNPVSLGKLDRQQTKFKGVRVGPGGKHAHAVVGGDEETRPNNYAVRFIIKAR